MTTTVHLRNSARQRVVEVADYTLTATLILNSSGTYELVVPGDSLTAQAVTFLHGIVVTDDSGPVFSGPVTGLERKQEADGTATLVISGADDTDLLRRRLVLPGVAPYHTVMFDFITGNGETVLRHYVNISIGPGAAAARQHPGLILESVNHNRGTTALGQGRFVNLVELLQATAKSSGLAYRIVQVGLDLVFQVTVPRDVRTTAVFARERGTLSSYTYKTTAPTGNYVYVGGAGELMARAIYEYSDAASVAAYGRVEMFSDQQSEEDLAVIAQTGQQELVDNSASSTLALTPVDTEGLRFGRDYRLGDYVSVDVDGAVLTDVLRQVTLTYSPDLSTPRVVPVMASDGASMTGVNLFDKVRTLSRRTSRLERR